MASFFSEEEQAAGDLDSRNVTDRVKYFGDPPYPSRTGGHADIYQGNIEGLSVAIKVMRFIRVDQSRRLSLIQVSALRRNNESLLATKQVIPLFTENEERDEHLVFVDTPERLTLQRILFLSWWRSRVGILSDFSMDVKWNGH